jgi:hypothetical protein
MPHRVCRSAEGYYFLLDCPGQVELFTLHDSLLAMLGVMDKQWHFRWVAPHLQRREREREMCYNLFT